MAGEHIGVQISHDSHEHTDTCGHEKRTHGDHSDYKHDLHWHAKHDDHWDEHVDAPQPPATIATWAWLVRNAREVGLILAGVAVALALVWLALFLAFPDLPRLGGDSSVEERSASVGAFLIFVGTVLTVVAFIPALVVTILSSFDLNEPEAGGTEVTPGGVTDALKAVIGSIPDLLKAPAGFGVVLALLGVILMSATALSEEVDPSPTPTPTATASTAPESEPPSAPPSGPSPSE